MPDARLKRTREAYAEAETYPIVAFGLCQCCFRHSELAEETPIARCVKCAKSRWRPMHENAAEHLARHVADAHLASLDDID